jgi:predicted MFS family arabinose efflux permease
MNTREILRRPGFRPLVTTYGLSEIVDWLTTIALAVLVYEATRSAVATTVLFVASKFVPAFVAPAITARVDRVAPRRSLPVLYGLQAAAFGGMAYFSASVTGVVILAALAGGAALVSRALVRAAVVAALPDKDDLARGNGLMNVVFSTAFAVGPAVAGAAVAAGGVELTLIAGAALLLWMALYAGVSVLPVLVVEDEEAGDGWWTRLNRAVQHVRCEPALARLFSTQGVLLVFFTMIPPIEVVYAREELGTTAAGFGALMAAWGVGAIVGSALFSRVARHGTLTVTIGASVAMGVSYLGMGLSTTLVAACLLSAVGGLGNGMQWIAFVTAVQERTPDALQARAMALVESLGAAVPGLGFALGGAIAAAASARVAYDVAGIAILTIALVGALVIRGLPGAQPQAAPAAA